MTRTFTYGTYTHGDNLVYRLIIPRNEIGFFSGTLEAYEGLGIVRTIDEHQGIIEVWVPRDREKEFESVLDTLKNELSIEVLART